MTLIRVLYFGMLRDLAGQREEKIEIDGAANLSELVKLISDRHSSKFENFVFESSGKLREGFAFAVDGSSISQPRLRQIKCKDVFEFAILPPISGGSF